jgi:hypothetical protein
MSYEVIKKYVEQNNKEKAPATSDVNGENPNKQGTGDQERLKGETRKPVDPRDINKDKNPGNSKQLKDIIVKKEENGAYGDRGARDPNSLLREHLGQLGDD